MIVLTILPPEYRERLRQRSHWSRLVRITLLTGLAVVACAALLVGAQAILRLRLRQLDEQLRQSGQQVSVTALQQSVGERYTLASDLQASGATHTPRLIEILRAIPINVNLTTVNYEPRTQSFSLQGVAKSRSDFLELRTNLSSLPFLTDLQAPISNLAQRATVTFSLEAKINQP